jgi:glycosyltransferase involved in cell wall biosynthesis
MRILHVHDQAAFQGGVEQILFDTARGLAARDWPQGLLTVDGPRDPRFCGAFDAIATSLQAAAGFQPDAVLIHKVADARRTAAVARTFPAAHMVHDHDLVYPRRHKYLPLSGDICTRPAGLGCFTRLCVVQRAPEGATIPLRLKGTGDVRRHLAAGQHVRRHLVGSAFMKRELAMNGIEPSRIAVIHPVPASLRQPAAAPLGAARELLFVGQVIRGKGVDLMLRALSRLEGDWRATIVGSGNHLQACRELSEELGIADQTRFAGWIEHDELERFYRQARAVVVPSRWPEPFGMVGIEAMARGRPVVAFDNGGISDWLQDGVTGLLAPPADVDALATAIQRLLDDPELAARMGRAGAERAAGQFSHQAYLAGISHHLETLQ